MRQWKQWTATVTWPNGVAKKVTLDAATVESAMLKTVLWSLLQRTPVRTPTRRAA